MFVSATLFRQRITDHRTGRRAISGTQLQQQMAGGV